MLVVLSPAKKLDWSQGAGTAVTEPPLRADANALAEVARKLSAAELGALMGISDKLATLNHRRFADFADDPEPEALRPAALAFAGDTYTGLDAPSLDDDALRWGQRHLRILSGLYGVLRPLDGIQPYRLEMGSKLANPGGRDLYAWWGSALAEALNTAAAEAGADVLVNCASQEYFGAVDRDTLALRIITPVFMEERGGAPKVVSFHAKKARGAMARFICEHRVTDPEALKDFDTGGYRFASALSEPDRPVFLREG